MGFSTRPRQAQTERIDYTDSAGRVLVYANGPHEYRGYWWVCVPDDVADDLGMGPYARSFQTTEEWNAKDWVLLLGKGIEALYGLGNPHLQPPIDLSQDETEAAVRVLIDVAGKPYGTLPYSVVSKIVEAINTGRHPTDRQPVD